MAPPQPGFFKKAHNFKKKIFKAIAAKVGLGLVAKKVLLKKLIKHKFDKKFKGGKESAPSRPTIHVEAREPIGPVFRTVDRLVPIQTFTAPAAQYVPHNSSPTIRPPSAPSAHYGAPPVPISSVEVLAPSAPLVFAPNSHSQSLHSNFAPSSVSENQHHADEFGFVQSLPFESSSSFGSAGPSPPFGQYPNSPDLSNEAKGMFPPSPSVILPPGSPSSNHISNSFESFDNLVANFPSDSYAAPAQFSNEASQPYFTPDTFAPGSSPFDASSYAS